MGTVCDKPADHHEISHSPDQVKNTSKKPSAKSVLNLRFLAFICHGGIIIADNYDLSTQT